MTTVVCHNCHRENSVGRGFCQFCGSRLGLSPAETDAIEPDAPRGGEHAIAILRQELELAKRALDAANEELNALKQKSTTDTSHESKERLAEEARLRDGLAESERNVSALRLELEGAKSQLGSTASQLNEHRAAGEQVVATLKHEHAGAIAKAAMDHQEQIAQKDALIDELKARGEQVVAALKQEHAGAMAKVAGDHQEKIARKDNLIEELKAKLHGFAERERTQLAAGQAALPGETAPQDGTSRRSFGTTALGTVAALFGGAGGIGGYFYRGDGGTKKDDQATVRTLQAKLAEADKLNRDLEDGLRSQHEAYERVNADLKRAEDQLKVQTAANPAAGASDDLRRQVDDLQRQMTEQRAADQQLQQKLGAAEAELAQRKQDIEARDRTIAQLNQQLEAKSQAATSHEPKEIRPKPRETIDIDTTIKNLEREYGIPRIGR